MESAEELNESRRRLCRTALDEILPDGDAPSGGELKLRMLWSGGGDSGCVDDVMLTDPHLEDALPALSKRTLDAANDFIGRFAPLCPKAVGIEKDCGGEMEGEVNLRTGEAALWATSYEEVEKEAERAATPPIPRSEGIADALIEDLGLRDRGHARAIGAASAALAEAVAESPSLAGALAGEPEVRVLAQYWGHGGFGEMDDARLANPPIANPLAAAGGKPLSDEVRKAFGAPDCRSALQALALAGGRPVESGNGGRIDVLIRVPAPDAGNGGFHIERTTILVKQVEQNMGQVGRLGPDPDISEAWRRRKPAGPKSPGAAPRP